MKNWLVVANSARARVLEGTDTSGAYTHVADLFHAESRQKGIELSNDRAGYAEGGGYGAGGTAYQPRSDPHRQEHDRFAQELAALLDQGVSDGRCAGLVLVASNPFLGLLKTHLAEHTRQRILRTVPSDYTSLRDDELAERLGAAPG